MGQPVQGLRCPSRTQVAEDHDRILSNRAETGKRGKLLVKRCFQVLLASFLLMQATVALAAVETLQFEIEGQTRRVLVHVPEGATDGPRPFVVVFHGLGDSNTIFANAVQFEKTWPEAIVAYPNGETRPDRSSQRGWQTRMGQYEDRDIKLVDRLLAEAATRYGIRPETSYAAGFSNGGHLTFLLLAERPHAFASFAVIGSVRPDLAGASTPRPLIYLWGRKESREYRDQWAETIEAATRFNRMQGPLTDYMDCCKTQSTGPGGAPFVFGLYNAGHVWPHRGNEWIKAFFTRDWNAPADGG